MEHLEQLLPENGQRQGQIMAVTVLLCFQSLKSGASSRLLGPYKYYDTHHPLLGIPGAISRA